MVESAGVKMVTVEQAFGNRPHMVTERGNPYHLQIRSVEELWHKENMINLGIRHARTLGEVREVAWIDADCRPAMIPRNWFEETWHQLQHYEFVQMWEFLQDLDIRHNPLGHALESFMARYIKYGSPTLAEWLDQKGCGEYDQGKKGRKFGAPGLAWAANIDAIDKLGGILDKSILGAGDWYMAHALIGTMQVVTSHFSSAAYARHLYHFQTLCERHIKRDVGYVPGMVFHDFHGPKAKRYYGTRSEILTRNAYDPDLDIKYDSYGQLQLESHEPRQLSLRDDIRQYFRARNEDATE